MGLICVKHFTKLSLQCYSLLYKNFQNFIDYLQYTLYTHGKLYLQIIESTGWIGTCVVWH